MRRRLPYPGTLAKPLSYSAFPTSILGGDNFRERQAIKFRRIILEKLDVLCRHYGVDSRDINQEHVLTLARRYVPGFQIDRGKPFLPGPRKKWDDPRLARLWLFFREVRPRFESDKSALAHIAKQKDLERITDKAKPIWLQQLLEKAKLSPLVQMMESSNPSDRDFAQKFLARHGRE